MYLKLRLTCLNDHLFLLGRGPGTRRPLMDTYQNTPALRIKPPSLFTALPGLTELRSCPKDPQVVFLTLILPTTPTTNLVFYFMTIRHPASPPFSTSNQSRPPSVFPIAVNETSTHLGAAAKITGGF